MSLINQMLQDLEQRSTGHAQEGMRGQIRAVPEREGVHTAWWLVMLLAGALVGLCAWLWLRQPASQTPAMQSGAVATQTVPAVQPVQPPVTAVAPLASTSAVVPATGADPITPPITGAIGEHSQNPVALVAPLAVSKPAAIKPVAAPSVRNSIAVSHDTNAKPKPADSKDAVAAQKDNPAKTVPAIGRDELNTDLARQIKQLTPQQRAENAYRAAAAALQQGRQAEAMSNLEQALQADPQHAAARQMLVGLLLQAKRNDDAIRNAQEGLSVDPSQVGLAMILARVQVDQGNLQTAIGTLNKSLQYATDRADYQAFLAALLQRDKRHKEAIDHYLAALGKSPQTGVWWMGLGISLQAENRTADAKEAFSRAKATNTLTPELTSFVDQRLLQLK